MHGAILHAWALSISALISAALTNSAAEYAASRAGVHALVEEQRPAVEFFPVEEDDARNHRSS